MRTALRLAPLLAALGLAVGPARGADPAGRVVAVEGAATDLGETPIVVALKTKSEI